MGNMGYCRFENTYDDLQDCYEHLNDNEEEMSKEGKRAKKNLIDLCKDIAKEAEKIEEEEK